MKPVAAFCVLMAAFAGCSLIAWAGGQRTPPAHFSLAIRSTSEEISLACEEGCAWKTLRFGATRTAVLFGDKGLLAERPDEGAGVHGFVIAVSAAGNRLELTCNSGCRWKAVFEPGFDVKRFDENGPVRTSADRGFAASQSQSQAPENQASQFPSQWKWPAVGSTMRVRIVEGERIDAENVMIPDLVERKSAGRFPPFGGIESAHLSKMGTMYAGDYSSAQVCFYTDNDVAESQSRCRFQTAIEITLLTPTRIEGRAESEFAFDCRSCRITGKPRMKPFVWTPVK